MDNEKKEIKRKQAYEKPRLRVIELVAEEVMGVGCKNASGGAGPLSTCVLSGCSVLGS